MHQRFGDVLVALTLDNSNLDMHRCHPQEHRKQSDWIIPAHLSRSNLYIHEMIISNAQISVPDSLDKCPVGPRTGKALPALTKVS